jgi:hypothetical protein
MTRMKRTFGNATRRQIEEFETRNGITLPEPYRSFLAETNGGRPLNQEFVVEGWGSSGVSDFYAIGTGNSFDLDAARDRFLDVLPKDVLAIASDPGGNQICLGLNADLAGKIFFWDHEDASRQLREISPSFQSFVNDLKPDGWFDDAPGR